MKTVTILGAASPLPLAKGATSAVLVQVIDLDPALLGKALQLGDLQSVNVADGKETLAAVVAAYPGYTLFASPEEFSFAAADLLVQAGLRVRTPDGKVTLSPRAARIDAGLESA